MLQQEDGTNMLPQRKMSRYRSQRTSTSAVAQSAPPLPQTTADHIADVSEHDPTVRSRSRYHATASSSSFRPFRDGSHGAQRSTPPDLVLRTTRSREGGDTASPQSPRSGWMQSPREQDEIRHTGGTGRRRYVAQRVDSGAMLRSSPSYQSMDSRTENVFVPAHAQKHSLPPAAELFPPIRSTSPQHLDESSTIDQMRAAPITGSELFPPMRPPTPQHVDGPPRSDQIRATRSAALLTTATTTNSLGDEHAGIFKMFHRRRHGRRSSMDEEKHTMNGISQDSKSTRKPAAFDTDAPISAVNAGERRVMVECGSSKMMYPVTPTTTPVDLIRSASNTMSENFNARSAVMLEYFTTVGVHRPLRRYEHIRDVMNSWDHDMQNTLLIIDPGVGARDEELNLSGSPKHKPRADQKWSLHFSQTVGKWDKRGITLKPDGQLLMLKDPRKPDDLVNICRLSDFDIYTPTPEKIKKKIKPPKKHCFAIKSQQKSSMFESTTNFVHFFCTADQKDADSFHAAIQSWRSWYLVNIMGEGTKNSVQPVTSPTKLLTSAKATVRQHKRTDTLDSHYQLGTFSPLIDLDQFVYPETGSTQADTNKPHQSYQCNPHRPVPQKKLEQSSAILVTAQLDDDEPLAHLERKLSRTGSRRPKPDSQLLRRRESSTKASHQKPLVKLSEEPREPIRHTSKGHGHRPSQVGRGGLIEAATSTIEANLSAQGTSREPAIRARASIDVGSGQQAPFHRPGTETDQAFTGEGLLATTQGSWGSGNRGRGVIDGSRATGPMVDLPINNRFAQGSLLRQVERQQGPPQPAIDRQKYVERIAKTGEGY